MKPIPLRKGRDDHSHDWNGLADALAANVRGEVRFDGGARSLYSTDASNYRQLPIGVVLPRDIDDVITVVSTCRAWPVSSRAWCSMICGGKPRRTTSRFRPIPRRTRGTRSGG